MTSGSNNSSPARTLQRSAITADSNAAKQIFIGSLSQNSRALSGAR
jgi:hypothetical protein